MKELPVYKTIIYSQSESVGVVTLNRLDFLNSLNSEMVNELYDIFSKLQYDNDIKCIVLTGTGKYFCKGMDQSYLLDSLDKPYRENYNENLLIAKLLFLIYTHSKPVIAKVNGDAMSVGAGLFSVCDIVIAEKDARFSFNYTKLGLVPSVILPYLIKRIGECNAREYLLTGEEITAQRAADIGLVNYFVSENKLDELVNEKIKYLVANNSKAMASTKEIFSNISLMRFDELLKYTAEMITEFILSDEGHEGVKAFINESAPKR